MPDCKKVAFELRFYDFKDFESKFAERSSTTSISSRFS
jgi:hypothetical protein